MADVLTFEEHQRPITGRTIAWSGDANNVLASWVHAAQRFDFAFAFATPPEFSPPKSSRLGASNGARSPSPTIPSRRSKAPIAR